MKRTLSVALALGLVATLASAVDVTSNNTVGYKTLTADGPNFNMLAVNWDKVLGGDIDIQDVFEDVSGLTGSGGADTSDNLLVWDPNTAGYALYFLYDSGGAYPSWDGQWVDSATFTIASTPFPAGTAFWLKTIGSDADLTIAGQVPTAASDAKTIYGGTFTMIGSSFSADMPLNGSFDWLAAGGQGSGGADTADNILVWDPNTAGYALYFLYDSGGAYPSWDGKWVDSATFTITGDSLGLGYGAWYKSLAGGSNFTWTEAKPY